MKLLANSKSKGKNQEKSPAKKKLSELARTLKRIDVRAAFRTIRAAFTLVVDRSTLACVASGVAACSLASLLIEHSDFARSVAFLSYSIPQGGWVTLSCCLTAMLIAECICRVVAGAKRHLPFLVFFVVAVLAAILGSVAAPLFATFPPVAMLLIRILCPEQLYYPRPYKKQPPITLYELFNIVRLAFFALVFSIVLLSVSSGSTNMASSELVYGGFVIAFLFLWRMRKRWGYVAEGRFVASSVFRCLWMFGWLALFLIVRFSILAMAAS